MHSTATSYAAPRMLHLRSKLSILLNSDPTLLVSGAGARLRACCRWLQDALDAFPASRLLQKGMTRLNPIYNGYTSCHLASVQILAHGTGLHQAPYGQYAWEGIISEKALQNFHQARGSWKALREASHGLTQGLLL